MQRPIDAVPQKRPGRVLAANRQAEGGILTATRIHSLQRVARADLKNANSRRVVEAALRSGGKSEGPRKEINHVTYAAAQDRQGLEDQSEAARNEHGGQGDEEETRPQLPQRKKP